MRQELTNKLNEVKALEVKLGKMVMKAAIPFKSANIFSDMLHDAKSKIEKAFNSEVSEQAKVLVDTDRAITQVSCLVK